MFRELPTEHGRHYESADDDFPTAVAVWTGDPLLLSAGDTHFGFVQEGPVSLDVGTHRWPLEAGMFFSAVGGGSVRGGRGVVVTRRGWRGLTQCGGPVERTGRLRYIDGCSDTLLVGPPVLGDACLNLLHIPPGTHQTAHTHPTIRAGVIAAGEGRCVTPGGEHPLRPGTAFVIEPQTVHSFHTGDSDLLVIAYHPDSDFGPAHDDHPMVNRTIVNGVSASRLHDIRTGADG